MVKYAKLRRLMEPRAEDLDQTFQRLAYSLQNSGKTATVQCTILGGDKPRHWSLELRGRECRVGDPVKVPDLEIITKDATWWEIAEGKLSPLDAFREGRLRILGDTQLGSHLLKLAAEGGGAVAICGE